MKDIQITQEAQFDWKLTWSDAKGVRQLAQFEYFEDLSRFVEGELLAS